MRNLASGRAGNNFFRAMECEQVGDPFALSASSCRIGSLHMSGRDPRTPAGHIYASEKNIANEINTNTSPLPYTSIQSYIHTFIPGFSLASFAIPFLAIDLLIALRLAYMI
jgi:hypothetical protein